MSANQVINAFDLLGQTPPRRRSLPWQQLPSSCAPQLQVAWGSFRQSFFSSLRASLALAPRKFSGGEFFRDCWVGRRIPARAVIAAALWHIVFLVFPLPKVQLSPRRNPAFDNTELTWSGPIDDLPLLDPRPETPKPKPTPPGEPETPEPAPGAAAFHPRQRIFTDPVHPTHPRQMLVSSAAPPDAPRILPSLPNIVQLAETAVPDRPHIPISPQTLEKLRPRLRPRASDPQPPPPDPGNLEQNPAPISIAALTTPENLPQRPKLEINAGVAPRLAAKRQSGDVGPAPDIAQPEAAGGPATTFIALSANPAPAPPPKPPEGNLAARVSISPEGQQPGPPAAAPGAAPSNAGSSAGNNSAAINISGGNPVAKTGVSALHLGKPSSPRAKYTREDRDADDFSLRAGPPNFAALPPGAKPEAALGAKKIYTLYVNMPNLNSATGSWILNFSELRMNPGAPRIASRGLAAPVPLRKVDPKYPPALISEHVEGEVILYAVIRGTGTIDSIQLVRGVDEQLDENAMEALAQWKFRPAERDGAPVDLEAIVHIPFHAPVRP